MTIANELTAAIEKLETQRNNSSNPETQKAIDLLIRELCYLLFSGDNQMEWSTLEEMEAKVAEVVKQVNKNFVEETLAKICSTVGIDPFNNFDQIVDFIIEDVKTAGMGDFSDENIRIAFRRFVEREM